MVDALNTTIKVSESTFNVPDVYQVKFCNDHLDVSWID